jgi:hypothetical protein
MIVLRDKLFVFSNPYNGIYLFSIKLDLNEGNKLEKLVQIMEYRNWDSGIFNLDVYFDKKVNILDMVFRDYDTEIGSGNEAIEMFIPFDRDWEYFPEELKEKIERLIILL